MIYRILLTILIWFVCTVIAFFGAIMATFMADTGPNMQATILLMTVLILWIIGILYGLWIPIRYYLTEHKKKN